ncbi:ACP S-malonyltransferase [Anatilimnocola floriformis]|uniref:ACP S-malonyltransferase n=1 Tax=Anatilimnocola floriformis TaxID=2948575 RepID=UPI0020C36FDB|nr:ACP S-malonyltransferase [Anatilimnocola floriformis]
MSKIALLFPGQGAQAVGMGRQLAESLPAARSLFDRAQAVLGYDLAEVCFNGPAEKLDSTVYSQPALFVCSLAALESLKATKPEVAAEAKATAGLSLGEYTALVFAEAITFEDGLKLVAERGSAMQAAADLVPSGMVSVLGLDLDKVQAVCDEARQPGEVLQIANHLCPGNIVISGHTSACERVPAIAEKAGAMKTIRLSVAGAFHTPLMAPAVQRLTSALAHVPIKPPRIPVISNVDALSHDDPHEIRHLLVQQVVSPVRWEDSMRVLLNMGVTPFWEIGPGRVLRGLLKRIDRKVAADGIEC